MGSKIYERSIYTIEHMQKFYEVAKPVLQKYINDVSIRGTMSRIIEEVELGLKNAKNVNVVLISKK